MEHLELLTVPYLIIAALMTVFWLYQLQVKRADIVDAGWAAGLGIFALYYACYAEGDAGRRATLGLLSGGWSLRLTFHLLADRVLSPNEDGRYQALRQKWGNSSNVKFFFFFQAQAVLAALLSITLLQVAVNKASFAGLSDIIGIALFVVGLVGESAADRQLERFKRDPANKGRTCRVGLWRYSRHPNYFFEWLHWCAYPFLAWPTPYWFLAISGPAIMLYLILKVTGIPPTEARALLTRGEDYREYQRTTSSFVPWFPAAGEAPQN
ncbi:MAG: DUF1295 domain-containing protein [Deltaproteobacteria bacterium]|nr:DUF1295 domain-containing protein [Deltaproteobacteria bacterium]